MYNYDLLYRLFINQVLPSIQDSHLANIETTMAARETLEAQQRQTMFNQWRVKQKAIGEGKQVQQFQAQLSRWAVGCVLCRLYQREMDHTLEACPLQEGDNTDNIIWHFADEYAEALDKTMFGGGRFA